LIDIANVWRDIIRIVNSRLSLREEFFNPIIFWFSVRMIIFEIGFIRFILKKHVG
jgi:hypothetical protein